MNETEGRWLIGESGKMEYVNNKYNPGMLKLFDEIALNALDQSKESSRVTNIDITVTPDSVSIYNNGPGIPIKIHKVHNVYVPELIFSQFLTSTSYNLDDKRLKAGLNGLGAKITSTLSTMFRVETVSGGLKYTQTFLNNMEIIEPPVIENTTEEEHTEDYIHTRYETIQDQEDHI